MGKSLECVKECRALLVLRVEVNVSTKFLYNQLTDDKSQANTIGIDLSFIVFERAKELEQLILIFNFDTFSIVLDRDSQGVILKSFYHQLDLSTSVAELDCIREEVEQHLLHPLDVCFDEVLSLKLLIMVLDF